MTYTYLVEHPLELKKALDRCQTEQVNPTELNCDEVKKAAERVMTILNEQQADPEKFGEKILSTEVEFVNLKKELQQAQENLAQLKAKNASAEEIKAAEAKIQLVEKTYQDKRREKREMLAIVGLSSPE